MHARTGSPRRAGLEWRVPARGLFTRHVLRSEATPLGSCLVWLTPLDRLQVVFGAFAISAALSGSPAADGWAEWDETVLAPAVATVASTAQQARAALPLISSQASRAEELVDFDEYSIV